MLPIRLTYLLTFWFTWKKPGLNHFIVVVDGLACCSLRFARVNSPVLFP
jgi:hypothetical protein